MFVRIRHSDESSTLYEADRVYFDSGASGSESEVHLTITSGADVRRVVVEKAKEELYLMNDDGETIESYRWEPLKE